jgi:hypothetical protein
MFNKLSCLWYKIPAGFKGEMTIQTLYAANGGEILPVFNNGNADYQHFQSVHGVHDSEREHFGVLKAFEGVLRLVLVDTDCGLKLTK